LAGRSSRRRAQGHLPVAETLEEIADMALIAWHDGAQIAADSHRPFDHLGIAFDAAVKDGIAKLHKQGHTVVIVAHEDKAAGLL
jgi:cation transport ATPase